MNRYKHLIKNMGFLTIGQFGTKVLSFLLVPLYTKVLSTEEYGTYDLFNTVVSLLIPILTFNISSALIRFPIDGEDDPREIFSIGMGRILKSIIVFSALILINYYFNFFTIINAYPVCLLLMFVSSVIYDALCFFTRGIDNVFAMSMAGVINSLFSLSLTVVCLVYLKAGLVGYFYANIVGTLIAIFYLAIRIKAWKYLKLRQRDKDLRDRMFKYTIPMVANSISWWMNSSLDRFVIIGLYGVSENGIYSVASKIPGIIQIVQTIFNQAWSLSATRFFDSEDENGFFSNIYGLYNTVLVFGCSIVIVFTKFLAKRLYDAEFYPAWRYVPFLCIAVVFTALSGYVSGIFTALKKSKMLGATTVGSAAINCIFNFILVWKFGVIGAAISTMLSYYILWFIRLAYAKRLIKIKLHMVRDHVSYIILLIQSVLMLYLNDSWVLYVLEIILSTVILLIFKSELKKVITQIKNMGVQKSKN